MSVDYITADRVVELAFGKFDKPKSKMDFPKPGTLSKHFNVLLNGSHATPTLSHQHSPMLATAGVEMWHRAIHSFLWSVALTKSSPLWASVSGYYASHFVMRALAHSMGIFKSFAQKEVIQISVENGQFVCLPLKWSSNAKGEHAFYWKAVKGHPKFVSNDLFHENSERDPKSDAAHRTFANYTDHLCSFPPIEFPKWKMLQILWKRSAAYAYIQLPIRLVTTILIFRTSKFLLFSESLRSKIFLMIRFRKVGFGGRTADRVGAKM
jgi:hypothetical protein